MNGHYLFLSHGLFFRDFSVLPAVNPLEIIFISLVGGLLSPAS